MRIIQENHTKDELIKAVDRLSKKVEVSQSCVRYLRHLGRKLDRVHYDSQSIKKRNDLYNYLLQGPPTESRYEVEPMVATILRSAKRQIKPWVEDLGIDFEMTAMKISDAADLVQIAVLLERGNRRKAGELFCCLDTACAEELPNKAYHYFYRFC